MEQFEPKDHRLLLQLLSVFGCGPGRFDEIAVSYRHPHH